MATIVPLDAPPGPPPKMATIVPPAVGGASSGVRGSGAAERLLWGGGSGRAWSWDCQRGQAQRARVRGLGGAEL
eukprot:7420536-Alexandrium_andersonii.AAC.1